jgi:hypothetical protein
MERLAAAAAWAAERLGEQAVLAGVAAAGDRPDPGALAGLVAADVAALGGPAGLAAALAAYLSAHAGFTGAAAAAGDAGLTQ